MPLTEWTWSVKTPMGDLVAIKGTFAHGEDPESLLAEARRLAATVLAAPDEAGVAVWVTGTAYDDVETRDGLKARGFGWDPETQAWSATLAESAATAAMAWAGKRGLTVHTSPPDTDPDALPTEPVVAHKTPASRGPDATTAQLRKIAVLRRQINDLGGAAGAVIPDDDDIRDKAHASHVIDKGVELRDQLKALEAKRDDRVPGVGA